MEAKRIEISALLRASHKKSDIAKLLNVSRMSVHRVASRLRYSKTLKDRPRTGRPRVVKTETIRKAFKNDPTLKMTHLARKKNISVSAVRRAVKIERRKSLKRVKKPLLSAAMKVTTFLTIWKIMGIGLSFFRMRKRSRSILLWTSSMIALLGSVRTFELRYVSTTKHSASVMMLGVVASNGEKMPLPTWLQANRCYLSQQRCSCHENPTSGEKNN